MISVMFNYFLVYKLQLILAKIQVKFIKIYDD